MRVIVWNWEARATISGVLGFTVTPSIKFFTEPKSDARYFNSCSFWVANCATSLAGFSFCICS